MKKVLKYARVHSFRSLSNDDIIQVVMPGKSIPVHNVKVGDLPERLATPSSICVTSPSRTRRKPTMACTS